MAQPPGQRTWLHLPEVYLAGLNPPREPPFWRLRWPAVAQNLFLQAFPDRLPQAELQSVPETRSSVDRSCSGSEVAPDPTVALSRATRRLWWIQLSLRQKRLEPRQPSPKPTNRHQAP